MSAIIGIFNRAQKSDTINYLVHFWNSTGLLEGLDTETREKVAISFELAARMMLVREDIDKMSMDIVGRYTFDDESRFATVLFPVIRRIVSTEKEAYKYFIDMFASIYGHMNSALAIGIIDGNKECRRYFYDNKVIPNSRRKNYQMKYDSYDEMKRESVFKHGGKDLLDWEAEYAAYVSDIVIEEIRSYGEKVGV